jgi:predicted transcriptional regulator
MAACACEVSRPPARDREPGRVAARTEAAEAGDWSRYRRGYSKVVNRLGELERAIMDVLWESRDPLTVRQVSSSLTERDLAHTTVMTVLDRLAKKGFARRERDGRAWRYRAAATREAYVTELMLNALEQTGDRHAALARFARSVSDTEAAALRRALEALGNSAAHEDGAREDGHGPVREATGE